MSSQITSSDPVFKTYHPLLHVTPLLINNITFFTNVSQTARPSFEDFLPRETFFQKEVIDFTIFDQTANGWISYIREVFYDIPQVESIYYTIDNTDIDIWLIIPTRDFSLLRRLVDLEMSVLDIFISADLSF